MHVVLFREGGDFRFEVPRWRSKSLWGPGEIWKVGGMTVDGGTQGRMLLSDQ